MSNNHNALALFIKQLSHDPGVYRMYDAQGNVLYVGKASNLKKRVSSYFNKIQPHKIATLVRQIVSIEVSVTRSETEALLLESNFIKALKPKYNVLLRDDKSYPYIYVSEHPHFPKIVMQRFKKKPKQGLFFGPYPSVVAVKETLTAIQKIFKIRNCNDTFFSARTRPCLQYQIKRCSAPCTGFISKENYQHSIKDAIEFLQGRSQNLLELLEKRMEAASNQLAFELASELRDQIKALRLVQESQAIIQIRGDLDVIVIDARLSFAAIQWISIRKGEVIASQSFFPKLKEENLLESEDELDDLWEEIFEAFISDFYFETPQRIPDQILTNHPLSNKTILEEALSSLKLSACKIKINGRGVKRRWIDFALNNLSRSIENHLVSYSLNKARYEALQSFLKRTDPILRVECFDISHTQGNETIASCVVFDEKGPNKKEYRRFNILGIIPGDDIAAMGQVLFRRYKHLVEENRPTPDLIIIDGGQNQVNMARAVLESLSLSHITLLGIAKGPTRKPGLEQLILSGSDGNNFELTLAKDSKALHLLQHIRDEAHRFAVISHRKKRQKSAFSSTLQTLEGIGPKRKQALLKRFGGLKELSKASIQEIAKVRGISSALAEKIYQHFH